ncbi:MAG: beta-ketoacyl-ACP synthase II [Candidatus Sumerlaeia bacterium]|nr:beta-ketoacyl-ACP synthase II [Candidatus Sumerlaeia bacterium]
MRNHRVVVTGMGAITPVGNTVPEFWESILAGKSGAGPTTLIDVSSHKVKFSCEVKNYDVTAHFDRKQIRRLDRFIQFGIVAAREALKDSGLDIEEVGSENVGVFIGSGIGGLNILEEQMALMVNRGPNVVSPLLIPRMIPNMAAGQLSIELGLKGPNSCVVTACASGTHSIGDAFNVIRRGQATAMICGGTEACITQLGVAGFENMKALSERNDSPETASRPFSLSRDGFVMAEGAGVLMLEDYENARKRGAHIYAEVVGYGMTGDAHHITAPAPEGEGARRSMAMALKDAELNPEDISYINAHGTSTPLNDKFETMAVKGLFREGAKKIPPMSSTKGSTGHLLGAAGGVEAVAAIMAIEKNIIPPTANYIDADPECDLDYVTEGARELPISSTMSNSFGFGGHNTTLVFKRL